jgi:non-heme chloroperoxidase
VGSANAAAVASDARVVRRLEPKLIKNSTLKVYPGYPHGMLSVHADVINPDLLAFVKG